jgi:hypothetical protein
MQHLIKKNLGEKLEPQKINEEVCFLFTPNECITPELFPIVFTIEFFLLYRETSMKLFMNLCCAV